MNKIMYINTSKKKKKINKIILSIFLFVAIATLLMKIIDGILLDLGYGIDNKQTFVFYYWRQIKYIKAMSNSVHINYMVKQHPHTFWFLTQFTWLTTIFTIILMTFRFFKYDGKVPVWLKWVMEESTLSLATIYEIIVGTIFWSAMFQGFSKNFNPILKELEISYTILVHTIIPIFTIFYFIFNLINDNNAKKIGEMTIWKGMVYPILYLSFYTLLSQIWEDPYSITNLHENFIENVWKLPVTILGFFVLIGIMTIVHNFLLVKFNKKYDPNKDVYNNF